MRNVTFFMYNLIINNNDRKDTIIWGLDYQSHNTRSEDTINILIC